MSVFDQLSPWHRAQLTAHDAAEDAAFRRGEFERQADMENRQLDAEWQDQLFRAEHGMPRHEYDAVMASMREAASARDAGAEYGSERRPAVMVGDVAVGPREAVQRPEQGTVARSARDDDVVRRYHQMGAEFEQIVARIRQPRRSGYLSRTY